MISHMLFIAVRDIETVLESEHWQGLYAGHEDELRALLDRMYKTHTKMEQVEQEAMSNDGSLDLAK